MLHSITEFLELGNTLEQVDKSKLIPLREYIETNPKEFVFHRDLGKWYSVFESDSVEIIDSKEIYVDFGENAPFSVRVPIRKTVNSIADVIVVNIDNQRISAAYTVAETTRKRFELPAEHRLLDYLFVEAKSEYNCVNKAEA